MARLRPLAGFVVAALLSAAASGCARFGFTDRVLHRIPAPDRQSVAVCQEVPELDGPSFDVGLERPDGTRLRQLFHMGDGGGCDEMVWSGDGQRLAVLTSHAALVTIVDVGWAVARPGVPDPHWFKREFSYGRQGGRPQYATGLAFISAGELQFQICGYSLEDTQTRRGEIRCAGPARRQMLRIPEPLVAGARP